MPCKKSCKPKCDEHHPVEKGEEALCGPFPGAGPNQQNTGMYSVDSGITFANVTKLAANSAICSHKLIRDTFLIPAGYPSDRIIVTGFAEAFSAAPAICGNTLYISSQAGTGQQTNGQFNNLIGLPWLSNYGTFSRRDGKFYVRKQADLFCVDAGLSYYKTPATFAGVQNIQNNPTTEVVRGTDAAVYAIDIPTWKIKWRFNTSENTPTSNIQSPLNPNSAITTKLGLGERWLGQTTPRVTKDMVYVAGTRVWAINKETGVLVWSKLVDEANPNRNPNGENIPGDGIIGSYANDITGNLVVVDNMVIVPIANYHNLNIVTAEPSNIIKGTFKGSLASGSYVAFNRFNGHEIWRVRTSGVPVLHPPADNPCFCIDGKKVPWGAGVGCFSTPSIDTELHLMFGGTGQSHEAPVSPLSDNLLAINYRTGKLVWSHQYSEGDYWNQFLNPGDLADPRPQDNDVGDSPRLCEALVNGVMRKLVICGDKSARVKFFLRDPKPGELQGKYKRQKELFTLIVYPKTPNSGWSVLNYINGGAVDNDKKILYVGAGRFTGSAPDLNTRTVAYNLNKLITKGLASPNKEVIGYGTNDYMNTLVTDGIVRWYTPTTTLDNKTISNGLFYQTALYLDGSGTNFQIKALNADTGAEVAVLPIFQNLSGLPGLYTFPFGQMALSGGKLFVSGFTLGSDHLTRDRNLLQTPSYGYMTMCSVPS